MPSMRQVLRSRVFGRLAVLVGFGVVLWTCATLEPDRNERALGTEAPEVALLTPTGEAFSWDSFGDRSPVLVFYRGRW